MVNNNSTNTNRFFAGVRNKLYPLFWFIASSNEKILRESPTQEQDKHFGYGMAILLTAIAAVASGYFAFSHIIRDDQGDPKVIPALLVSLLWGFLILNLDRIMVGSMKKDIFNRRIKELLPVIPRIILAAVIALVISKPIEIELLKKQIVVDQIKKRGREVVGTLSALDEEISGRKKEVDEAKKAVAFLGQDKKGIKKEQQYLDLNTRFENCTKKANKLNSDKNEIQYQIRSLDLDGRYSFTIEEKDSTGAIIRKNRKLNKTGEDRKEYLLNLLNQVISEINGLNCSIYEDQMNAYYDKRLAEIDTNISQESKTIQINSAWVNNKQDDRDKTRGENEKVLITADTDFFGLLDDLNTLKVNNSSIWWASLLLSMLFFILEIAPIFVKWISDRGIYDELLEADENFIRNDIRLKISENQTQLQSAIANSEAYLNADTLANQELLSKVMAAQSVIGQRIVEEWQKSELDKLNGDREAYLNDHIVQS